MNGNPADPARAADQAQTLAEANRALQDAQWAEKAGLPDRAITEYRKLAALCPDMHQVHCNLADLLLATGRADEALESARRATALQPADPVAQANVGRALVALGRPEEAVPHLRTALAAQPALTPLRAQLADTLLHLGRRDEALAAFTEIDGRLPDDPDLLKSMASLYHRAQAGALAEQAYLRLVGLLPTRDATFNDLAQLYIDFTQFSKAREMALKGLALKPEQPALWNTLALAQSSLGLVTDALASFRKVMEISPNLAISHSNMLLTMHYSTDVDAEQMAEEHRRWGRMHAPPSLATRSFANRPDPARRLRVGYVSPDFRRHSVSFFFESVLDHRDRDAFEVYCYGDVKSPDEFTQRIKSKADHYRHILDLTDGQVTELIRADGIDVLVDLAGHAGTCRTTLLGYKAAPVQVTWCGYPDTTGIEAVDYRITDALADPPGVEPLYTERLVRLPGGFLCYRPPESAPALSPAPSLAGAPFTFGSFNREFKFSQDTYDMWCRILRQLPAARMMVKAVSGGDLGTQERLLGEFERRGVARDRVELVGFIGDQGGHLATYRRVDVALDTYPYHGTTTTFDALLMSVPVVTLAGYNHASRVGASLLARVGLQDLVARSADEYVDMAVGLAADPGRLAGLHGSLRQRLLASSLCDGPGFNREFGYALRGMWCGWCREQGAGLDPAQQAMADFRFPPLGRAGTAY